MFIIKASFIIIKSNNLQLEYRTDTHRNVDSYKITVNISHYFMAQLTITKTYIFTQKLT